MPPRRPVELRVGGQTYRVVATDDDQHVQRLAELVDQKYVEIVPSRGVTPQQAIFLTAMALAEEVEEQRARATRLEAERDRSTHLAERAKDAVARLLKKVESALTPGSQTAAPTTSQDTTPTATPLADAAPPDPSDVRQSLPRDVRQSLPRETRQSPAREAHKPSSQGVAPIEEVARRPANTPPAQRAANARARRPANAPARRSPDAPDQQDESMDLLADLQRELLKTPREPAPRDVPQSLPRGGLRLLRQPTSLWSGATPAKPGPSDDETS